MTEGRLTKAEGMLKTLRQQLTVVRRAKAGVQVNFHSCIWFLADKSPGIPPEAQGTPEYVNSDASDIF